MTLSDFATFTTAISGIAVTISIVYLALQTHQNTRHVRAQINQGRVALIAELLLTGTDADVAAAGLLATTGSATPEAVKKRQFQFFVAAQMFGWQDSFSQHERGLLDEDIYKAMRVAIDQAFTQPAYREAYETLFRTPGTKFSAFVDEAIARLPQPAAGMKKPV
jgi:hypothetical protein